MERRLKSAELRSLLEELLALTTMTLATVGRDGEPHAAGVYFAADGSLNLFYFSETSSQHSRDSEHEPRAAVAIHPEVPDWQQIHGLQLRGSIRIVKSKTEWQVAWHLYRDKFPFVIDLEEVIKTNQMYAFKPAWIRLVDNRQGFGYKQEWEINTTEKVGDIPSTWQVIWETNG
jgi:uncharacterized protein YhbP (UPF0306 family)